MSILIFVIILAVLILVHEVGHFLAARSVGARVDEFGIGFPPRLWSHTPAGSETTYSVNAIPFGGFVKIAGENAYEESGESDEASRLLSHKGKWAQAWVLSAGVIFNTIFAWLLISVAFMSGVSTSVTPDTQGLIDTPKVMIINTLPNSPAKEAGLASGDAIVSLRSEEGEELIPKNVEDVQAFIGASADIPISLTYDRNGAIETVAVTPEEGIIEGKGALGVSLDFVGTVRLSPLFALIESAKTTAAFLKGIVVGLYHLIVSAFMGAADLADVSGPVGIVGLAGDAVGRGFIALLSFTALISLNLAVINLVPFPALDGGRLLFIVIEAVKGSPIRPKVSLWANAIGFAVLLLLMLAITVSDVVKLFAT